MREIAIKSIIAFLLLAARVASAQGTTTFLSNIGQSSAGSASAGSDSWLAVGFQTGANASGYLLNSVELGMADASGNPSGFTVMLYANGRPGGGAIPGSSLGTFIGTFDPSASGTYTFAAPSGLMLSQSLSYFIVITAGTTVANGAYDWSYAGANNYNPNGGWLPGSFYQSSNGSAWGFLSGDYFQFAINASVAPEPGVVGLLAVGGAVLLGAIVRGLKSKVRG